MSSNPLMMGYEGGDLLLTAWRCLANIRIAAQACVRMLWAVAWVVGGSR